MDGAGSEPREHGWPSSWKRNGISLKRSPLLVCNPACELGGCRDGHSPPPRPLSVPERSEDRHFRGQSLLDRHLEFVAGRVRPKTLRTVTFDLDAFFSVVEQDPNQVVPADVLGFRRRCVRPRPGSSAG